jgi:hypothetical protein
MGLAQNLIEEIYSYPLQMVMWQSQASVSNFYLFIIHIGVYVKFCSLI